MKILSLFAIRWAITFFIAFFLFLLIALPDRSIRLIAAIFLVVFLQLREILFFKYQDIHLKENLAKKAN